MYFDDSLSEIQIIRIKERTKKNFYEELKKSQELLERKKFAKDLRNQFEIFSTFLYNKGVLFYGFELSMPFLNNDDPDLWHYVHLQVEYWINEFKNNIELVEFSYISIEIDKLDSESGDKKKKFLPKLYGIFGVRSLIGLNDFHFAEIKKKFLNSQTDFFFKELNSLENIIEYWDFVTKEHNYKFHRFCQYSKFYDEFYGSIADLELQYCSEDRYAFCLDEISNISTSHLLGIQSRINAASYIINCLIVVFMNEKNIYLNNNLLYKKSDLYKNNWIIFDHIDLLKKKNIEIFEELKKLYPQQLGNLLLQPLFDAGWDIFYENLLKNNKNVLTIKFNNSVFELNNGFVFLQNIEYNESQNSLGFFLSNKFKKSKPKNWIRVSKKLLFDKYIFLTIYENFDSLIYFLERGIIDTNYLSADLVKFFKSLLFLNDDIFIKLKQELFQLYMYCFNIVNKNYNWIFCEKKFKIDEKKIKLLEDLC